MNIEEFKDATRYYNGWRSAPVYVDYLHGGGCAAAFHLKNNIIGVHLKVTISVDAGANGVPCTVFEVEYLPCSARVYTADDTMYMPDEGDILDIQGNILSRKLNTGG